MDKINISEKFKLFSDYFNPRIVADLNGQHVKLAKLKGKFIWHSHENEDELFLVVKGKLTIEFRDNSVEINEGEFIVIPKGTEHLPLADEEVHVILFEPAATRNTGNVINNFTKTDLEKI